MTPDPGAVPQRPETCDSQTLGMSRLITYKIVASFVMGAIGMVILLALLGGMVWMATHL